MKKIAPIILIGAIFCVLSIILRVNDPAPTSYLRASNFDTLQRIWPRTNATDPPVVVVDIDEASLRAIGQWPWPRANLAKIVDELGALGASAIVFDIVFPEPDRMGASNDFTFVQAIKSNPVITAFASSNGTFSTAPKLKAGFAQTGNPAFLAPPRLHQITQNLSIIDEAAAGIGSMNIDLTLSQGVTRQIPMLFSDGQTFYPSLSLEALRVAQGVDTYVVNASDKLENAIESIDVGGWELPVSEDGQFQIYYRHNTPSDFISAANLFEPSQSKKLKPLVQNKIVLIGTSAVGLQDMRISALAEAIPGVAVHAQALEQIMQGQFLSRPQWIEGLEIWGVAILSLLTALIVAVSRPLKSVIMALTTICAVTATSATAFLSQGLLIDMTWPTFTLAGTYILGTAYKLLITDHDGRKLRHAFGHYVAPAILAEIERNPEALKLGGELREVTVMFVDIENFTPLAETLTPEKLVQLVNEILQICSTCILAEGGTIDKYIGDAVMAFWNAPIVMPNHQYHACLAALQIQEKLKLYTFDQLEISVRIGIASGPATVGNMGSRDRFNYSVLGETVNTAARAEQACKQIGSSIVLAGKIQDQTKTLTTLPAGQIAMKGLSQTTQTYAILGGVDDPIRSSLLSATASLKTSEAHCESLAIQFPNQARFFRAIPARKKDFSNHEFTQ